MRERLFHSYRETNQENGLFHLVACFILTHTYFYSHLSSLLANETMRPCMRDVMVPHSFSFSECVCGCFNSSFCVSCTCVCMCSTCICIWVCVCVRFVLSSYHTQATLYLRVCERNFCDAVLAKACGTAVEPTATNIHSISSDPPKIDQKRSRICNEMWCVPKFFVDKKGPRKISTTKVKKIRKEKWKTNGWKQTKKRDEQREKRKTIEKRFSFFAFARIRLFILNFFFIS